MNSDLLNIHVLPLPKRNIIFLKPKGVWKETFHKKNSTYKGQYDTDDFYRSTTISLLPLSVPAPSSLSSSLLSLPALPPSSLAARTKFNQVYLDNVHELLLISCHVKRNVCRLQKIKLFYLKFE